MSSLLYIFTTLIVETARAEASALELILTEILSICRRA